MKKAWVKFFGNFMVFLLSIFLSITLIPVGILIELALNLIQLNFIKLLNRFSWYLSKLTISIDQLGNVALSRALNWIVKKEGGYEFGDEDDTISKALHYNYIQNKLTRVGVWLYYAIEWIDPGHFEGIENW